MLGTSCILRISFLYPVIPVRLWMSAILLGRLGLRLSMLVLTESGMVVTGRMWFRMLSSCLMRLSLVIGLFRCL